MKEETGSGTDWTAAYSAVRNTYERYCDKLRDLLALVLDTYGIEYVQMEGRAKDVASFTEKIQRKGGKYDDPLAEVTDLAGIRIIAYYVEDVERIASIIRQEFSVLEEHSGDKQAELADNEFGYASFHLVLELAEKRSSLLEWQEFAGRKAEIQVRTALQHAWAAVNHKLDYKKSQDSPRELRRRLFRLSALFELADEEFSKIRLEGERISADYVREVRSGTYDLEVNVDSVTAWIREDPLVARVRQIAHRIGWPLLGDSDPVPPVDRRDLVHFLNTQDMTRIGDLRDALDQGETLIEPVLRRFIDDEEEPHPTSMEDLMTQFLLVYKKAPVEVWNAYYEPTDAFSAARDLVP
ncbi:GTP pyrophosphokinase family protein [Streptomyces sp. NPDC015140]|uniref:GTP pyrophosphokinase n=1 Tax=Streptomyces sp. NPDC015140 TaxID=3364943 RepID=UPI0036FC3617